MLLQPDITQIEWKIISNVELTSYPNHYAQQL